MEQLRTVSAWVQVKFRDADGNDPLLDEVEVHVPEACSLLQLILVVAERLM